MRCLVLAILAGALIAESAVAFTPGGGSMPSAPAVSAPARPYVPSPPSHVRPPSISLSPIAPGIDAAKSAVRDAIDFATIKTKVRAKNPNATEDQVDAGAKKVLTQRRQREREAEDQKALVESKQKMDTFMKEQDTKRLAKEGGQSLISGLNHEERMMLGPGLIWLLPPMPLPH